MKYIEGGLAESGPLAGSGNFIAVTWDALADDVTSFKVGIVPTQGSGLVEAIGDPDRTLVAKVHDTTQNLVFVASDGTTVTTKAYSLGGITLLTE